MTKVKNSMPDYLSAAEGPFKKIYRILRDRRFVQYKLSIRLWRKSGRPKELAADLRRSDDGGLTTHFLRDPSSSAQKSAEPLEDRFAQIERSVSGYIVRNGLAEQWSELEASIKKVLQSGQSIDEILSATELSVLGFFEYGYEAHFVAPIIATACAMAGSRALLNNELSYASYCAERGLYWSSAEVLIPNPSERFTERASKGGQAKARLHEPGKAKVKDEVAKLLVELAPDAGWKSLSEATNQVARRLTEEHSVFVEKSGLKTDALPDTIRRWIDKEPSRFPYRLRSSD